MKRYRLKPSVYKITYDELLYEIFRTLSRTLQSQLDSVRISKKIVCKDFRSFHLCIPKSVSKYGHFLLSSQLPNSHSTLLTKPLRKSDHFLLSF